MKILVISDLHYPYCDVKELLNIVKKENPDKIILLGDIINKKEHYYDIFRILRDYLDKIIYICGDNERLLNIKCKKYFIINKILLYHGDSLNFLSERITKIIAKVIGKISKRILKEIMAFRARKRGYTVIIGHSHLLGKSLLFDVYFSGTLTKKSYFLERGYIVIENEKIICKKLPQ